MGRGRQRARRCEGTGGSGKHRPQPGSSGSWTAPGQPARWPAHEPMSQPGRDWGAHLNRALSAAYHMRRRKRGNCRQEGWGGRGGLRQGCCQPSPRAGGQAGRRAGGQAGSSNTRRHMRYTAAKRTQICSIQQPQATHPPGTLASPRGGAPAGSSPPPRQSRGHAGSCRLRAGGQEGQQCRGV